MQIRENISLRLYNTFGIDARARYFTTFQNREELQEILDSPFTIQHSPLILGGGSNILLISNVTGLVLRNEIGGIEVVKEDDEHIYVKAGAGVNWHNLVMYCVENGFAGMENLSLIWGSVGASPMQNIGAYGVEVKDIFHELEAYHLKEKVWKKFSGEECQFGYRESIFKSGLKGQFVITSVTFRLNRTPVFHTRYGAILEELERLGVQELSIKAISQAVINIRTSKLPDPKKVGNAGSFFKNPQVEKSFFEKLKNEYPAIPFFPVNETQIKVPAGWLIEQCGWKGYRKGDAGCYPYQALVLVNYGGANGDEIYQLSEEILHSVKRTFDIELEREVNII